jgi:hypothetical protein
LNPFSSNSTPFSSNWESLTRSNQYNLQNTIPQSVPRTQALNQAGVSALCPSRVFSFPHSRRSPHLFLTPSLIPHHELVSVLILCLLRRSIMEQETDMKIFKTLSSIPNLATKTSHHGPRLGQLVLPSRPALQTPHYLAITSRGPIPHISQDNEIRHTDVKGIYVAYEDCQLHIRVKHSS